MELLVYHQALFFEEHVEVVDRPVYLALLLRSGADELSGGEEQDDGLRVRHSVDQARELLWLVHRFGELSGGLFQVYLSSEVRRRNYVLYLYLSFVLYGDSTLPQ